MDENNKRIAKNTFYLYIRQFIILALSFITTRVVLDKLGASDYGINNLVAGFVASFAVLNNILSSSTRRFLALYIGERDENCLTKTFSTSLTLHFAIAIIVVIILESVGIWFLNTKLNIIPERMYAANWVFQLAMITTFFNIVQTPYLAAVTAHEKFTVYAAMSVYDVFAKLAIIYLLIFFHGDKLIIYSVLQTAVTLTSLLIYNIYCTRSFKECRLSLKTDKRLMKEMLSFSSWGVFGHIITVVNTQGISIILNIFFSTVINAARGLAQTVNFVIAQFITGFLTAAQPQLVKYYGAGEMDKFVRLIFNVTQYTLFLLALIAVPCVLEIDYVIGLWLGNEVPPYTCSFVKITLLCGIIYRSNSMVENGLNAIGRVKENNIYSVPAYLISIPLVYIVLKNDLSPNVAYWVSSVPPLISFIINLILLSKYTIFSGWKFFLDVFVKNIVLIILSAIIPILVQFNMNPGLVRFLTVCSISLLSTITIIWFLGLNESTKLMVKELIRRKLHINLSRSDK